MKKWTMASALLVAGALTAKAQSFQPPVEVLQLMSKHTCLTCHKMTEKSVGPAYSEIAKKKYSKKQITALVKKPVPGNWPDFAPMVGLTNIPKGDLDKIAAWIESVSK